MVFQDITTEVTSSLSGLLLHLFHRYSVYRPPMGRHGTLTLEIPGGVPKNGNGALPRKSLDKGERSRFFLEGSLPPGEIVSEVFEGTASSERALSRGVAFSIAQG